MALNFIRSRSDYQKWVEAINITKKRKAQRNPEDPNYDPKLKPIENVFAYANWLYHNVLSEGGSAILAEEEIDCPIKSDGHQEAFDWLQKKVFEEKSIEALDETKKWALVEDLYNEFVNKSPDMPMDKLEEFVDTQFSYSPGNTTIGALYGLGGYRNEPPIGPIVYGTPQNGINPITNRDGSKDGDPAVVVIPDKKSNYNPNDFTLDTLGNVVSDVEKSVNNVGTQPAEPAQADAGFSEDDTMELFDTLQELGYTQEQLQDMSDEELNNASRKALKVINKNKEKAALKESVSKHKTVKQKLYEAFFMTDTEEQPEVLDESSPTALARQILANKFKVGKAIKKGTNNKYLLNQDDISKLIRSQGYTWRKKYNKWVRKSSPTFWGRKLLSGKFQDQDAVKKDENNQYILNQDEISKRLNHRGYYWDMSKKMWLKVEKSDGDTSTVGAKKQEPQETPEQPAATTPEPQAADEKPEPQATAPETSSDYEAEDDTEAEPEKELNPLQDGANIAKMKLMQARFILAVIAEKSDTTLFNKDENGNEVPVIPDKDINEKITNNELSWDEIRKVWLDKNLSIPPKVMDIDETAKTLVARSFLAATDSPTPIKVNNSGLPSIKIEDLDGKMEKEGFVWNSDTNAWKYLGDEVQPDELDAEKLNEIMLKESVELTEKDLTLKTEALAEPKKKYKLNDVLDAQARMLMRAVQYDWARKASKIDKQKADQVWLASLADGKDGDPFNGHMDFTDIITDLKKSGYNYNGNKDIPMMTQGKSNKLPDILRVIGINDEKEYIARSILAKKDLSYAKTRANDITKPRMTRSPEEVNNEITDLGYSWHNDWGWTSGANTSNKAELDKQQWLDDNKDVPYDSLSGDEKKKYEEYTGYRIASKLIKRNPSEWDSLSPRDRNSGIQQLKKYYQFDKMKKQWIQREKPVDSGFLSKLGKIGVGLATNLGKATAKAGNIVKDVATKAGRYN